MSKVVNKTGNIPGATEMIAGAVRIATGLDDERSGAVVTPEMIRSGFGYYEDTIEDLKSRKGRYKLGDVVEVLGYYSKGDGSHHRRIAKAEDDGSGEQGQNGIWWCIAHSGEVDVSWFGAKGDGVTDDTIAIQKAVNLGGVVIMPIGSFVISKQLIIKANTCLKGENNTGTKLVFDSISVGNLITFGLCSKIENLLIQNKNSAFVGSFIINTSEQRGSDKKKVGSDRVYEFATSLNNLNIISNSNYQSDYNQTNAIKFEHSGIGAPLWGCDITNIKINGAIYNSVVIETRQDFEDSDPLSGVAWLNGLNFENITIYGAVNGVVLTTSNKFNSSTKAPISPSNHKFRNVQFQFVNKSEYTFKIENGSRIDIKDCTAYDVLDKKPFYIGNKSKVDFGTRAINIDPVVSLSHIEFEKNCPLPTYSVSTNTPDYSTVGGSTFLPPTGSGTNGKFTYRDLYELPPGFYTSSRSVASARNIGACLPSRSVEAFVLEVVQLYRGQKMFRFYPATCDDVSIVIQKRWQTVYHSFILKFEESFENSYLDNDIDYSFWRDCFGNSPDNIRQGTTSERPSGVVDGFHFFDTTTNEACYWDSGVGRWLTLKPTASAILQLDTPYYAYKMQQEGIYEDYIAYRDELHEYEKTQREIEEQRQLALENRQNQEQTYEEWLAEQPMLMPINQPPQMPVSVKNFAKEYGVI